MARSAVLHAPAAPATEATALAACAHPLRSSADLDPLLELIGDSRIVLLGEASHGTHEYYAWRTRLSRRLIEERGFDFIAVEGDWPDCWAFNAYIHGQPAASAAAEGLPMPPL